MEMYLRRRKVHAGIAEIADVIVDVLRDAEYKGAGGLNTPEVMAACGLDSEGGSPEWKAFGGVLEMMEKDGDVHNRTPGPGPSSWWLGRPG